MRWYKSTIEGAGLAKHDPGVVLVVIFSIAAGISLVSIQIFKVPALGVFLFLGILALEFETLAVFAKSRRRELAKFWPEVLDSMQSAVACGMTIMDAIDELSLFGPRILRQHFGLLSQRIDSGWGFEKAIDELKANLGEVHADRMCEVLRLVVVTGSQHLNSSLKQQSQSLRHDLAIEGQIESKQGWVSGTAKIAVAAPWVIVALLSSRPENAEIYNTPAGAIVLLVGFIVCVFAYRLVNFLGALPDQPRIFSS